MLLKLTSLYLFINVATRNFEITHVAHAHDLLCVSIAYCRLRFSVCPCIEAILPFYTVVHLPVELKSASLTSLLLVGD